MQALIDTLMLKLGVDDRQARGGMGALLRAAREKLGEAGLRDLTASLQGLDVEGLIREAPQPGAAGRLFGGLTRSVGGGNAAILAEVVAAFGKLGMSPERAHRFMEVMQSYVREHADPGAIERLEKVLRT